MAVDTLSDGGEWGSQSTRSGESEEPGEPVTRWVGTTVTPVGVPRTETPRQPTPDHEGLVNGG